MLLARHTQGTGPSSFGYQAPYESRSRWSCQYQPRFESKEDSLIMLGHPLRPINPCLLVRTRSNAIHWCLGSTLATHSYNRHHGLQCTMCICFGLLELHLEPYVLELKVMDALVSELEIVGIAGRVGHAAIASRRWVRSC